MKEFAASMEALKPTMVWMAKLYADARLVDAALAAGWVAFPGMPIDQLSKDASKDEIHHLLDRYTVDEWPTIKERIWQSVKSTGVDSEALATFDEALRAHESGLYRSAVRVLFPEIERVARSTVYEGSRWEEPVGKNKGALNAGLKDFRHVVQHNVPVGVVAKADFALTLVEKMCEHLYKAVGEDEASLNEFRNDPVPNRHASQHAFVIYSSRQHSFNALAMAAFMFQLIMSVHDYAAKLAASRAPEPPEAGPPTP